MLTIEGITTGSDGRLHIYSDAENQDPLDVTYGPFGVVPYTITTYLCTEGGTLVKIVIVTANFGTMASKVYTMTLLDDGKGRAHLLPYTTSSNAAQTDKVFVNSGPIRWCHQQNTPLPKHLASFSI